MSFWFANVGVTFLLCTFLAGIVIPQILLIAFRKRLFDIQDERKIHKGVVPRLGGIAFTPVIFFTIFFMLGVDLMLGHAEILSEVGRESRPVFFGFCSITILYLIGMADDLIGVKYRAKFAAQILCSILIIAGGIYIGDLHGIFGINRLPVWIGYLATPLAIVFIINAINLIDGIDGLASGLCSIVCLYYGIIFYIFGYYAYSMLSFATLGVLIPFFYYNVFGKVERHKKIFMGDTGSLTVGIMISFLGIKMTQCVPEAISQIYNPMILVFSPLIIPCLDVVRVYLHRIKTKKNPFLPDKNHIHHKLMALGLSQRPTMILIVTVALLLTLCNVFLSKYINATLLLIIDVTGWTLLNMWLTFKIKQKQKIIDR